MATTVVEKEIAITGTNMCLFKKDVLKIDDGIEEFKKDENSILLDVRTEEEYKESHILKSMNIPLQKIETIEMEITDKDTKLFVHCRSGVRSAQAVKILKKLGYKRVIDIGGILDYTGETVGG